MMSNNAASGSGIRHRHDGPSTLASRQSSESYRSDRSLRRSIRRDKGKRRAFGWGMGQEGWVEEGFRRFGEHCARNQIRTLLIDCLVMTNLFYPSLAIYLSKRFPPPSPDSPFARPRAGPSRIAPREHPLSVLSTRLLDSFFPYPPPLLPRLSWTGWWDDTPALGKGGEGEWYLERPDCEMEWLEEEIRVMRVAWTDVGGVLDGPRDEGGQERHQAVLRYMKNLAESWDNSDSASSGRCIRPDGEGTCLVFSPDEWENQGIWPIRMPAGSVTGPDDIYRGVVIPFRVGRGMSLEFERRWEEEMKTFARDVQGEVFKEARVTGRGQDVTGSWVLSFSDDLGTPPHLPTVEPTLSPSPSKLVYLLYLVLFSVLGHQLSNASKVHSRFGLAFTGCVQLCCSSVMSFSILALLGWNGWGVSMEPTTLPTYILPFVITVVGAENMSTLTKAVFSVPFTYSVPTRIGLALSKVGTAISITSISDLILLGIVWFVVNIRPVREFCVFAAVLIITDWFMLHTFFLTILSIDAQRLELADVLASSEGSVPPSSPANKIKHDSASPKRGWRKVIQARTAKGGSLIAILCCVGVIYYLTERHRLPSTAASLYGYDPTATVIKPSLRPTPTPFATSNGTLTPAEQLWLSLNPVGWPNIRIVLPPASILVLPRAGHAMAPASLRALAGNRPRSPYPRIKPLLHAIKVLILPQAVTALALYSLLLFLLKDKDLLDAQRNKLGRIEVDPKSGSNKQTLGKVSLASRLRVRMLPCSSGSDVDILAASKDGRLVISVSLDDLVYLWRFSDADTGGTRERLDLPDTEGRQSRPVVAASISTDGRWIAIAIRTGSITIWEVSEGGSTRTAETRDCIEQIRIADIAFLAPDNRSDDPFMSRSNSESSSSPPPILATTTSGSAFILDDSGTRAIVSAENEGLSRLHILRDDDACAVLTDGPRALCLWQRIRSCWEPTQLYSTRESQDRLTAQRSFPLNREEYGTIAILGFSSGLLEVFDHMGNLLIAIRHAEAIVSVDIARSEGSRCSTCQANLPVGFFVIASTATQTHTDLVHPRTQAPTCRCSAATPRQSTSYDGLSTSPLVRRGMTSLIIPPTPTLHATPGSSPRRSPSLLPPVSNGEFPLSSHGTRRYSTLHKDDMDHTAADTATWSDLDSTSLGAIATSGGGAVVFGNRVMALHRAGSEVDDSSWLILSIDLRSPWNGSTLVVGSANLSSVARRTAAEQIMGETSIRTSRNDRLLSLSGRISFPSLTAGTSRSVSAGTSGSTGSAGGLAYVDVRPIRALGTHGLVGGFGNRLGVITFQGEAEDRMNREGEGDQGRKAERGGSPFLVPPPPAARMSSKKSL